LSLRVEIAAEASSEIAEAMRWYEIREPGLGKLFWLEIKNTIKPATDFPMMFPAFGKLGVRRAQMQKFPYAIYYQLRNDLILLAGVIHISRDPELTRARFT
jgi:hypothetical protein